MNNESNQYTAEEDTSNSQYGDSNSLQKNGSQLSILTKGKMHILEVNGQKITVIDPSAIVQLENLVRQLERKLSILEHELVQTKSRLRRTNQHLEETSRSLDNKVSYE